MSKLNKKANRYRWTDRPTQIIEKLRFKKALIQYLFTLCIEDECKMPNTNLMQIELLKPGKGGPQINIHGANIKVIIHNVL